MTICSCKPAVPNQSGPTSNCAQPPSRRAQRHCKCVTLFICICLVLLITNCVQRIKKVSSLKLCIALRVGTSQSVHPMQRQPSLVTLNLNWLQTCHMAHSRAFPAGSFESWKMPCWWPHWRLTGLTITAVPPFWQFQNPYCGPKLCNTPRKSTVKWRWCAYLRLMSVQPVEAMLGLVCRILGLQAVSGCVHVDVGLSFQKDGQNLRFISKVPKFIWMITPLQHFRCGFVNSPSDMLFLNSA